ncbi:molybdenum cofactor guanylyltransferase [Natronomonas sp. EA1]|uniref:molybdenum cofactor guanylyltransferase n=1 Tax=Natronomonas sp. EA1 TaxID=3421655 RepID=UPI003EBD86D8
MTEGLIVAGGYSTRFGEPDKALARVGGVPMIRQVADALAAVTDGLVVNCRREQRPELEVALYPHEPRFVADLVPDEGPVAGLFTGLRAARASRVVAIACDQPLVTPYDLECLLAADEGSGAVPETGARTQPFPAVYPTAATREACERTLACGSRRLAEVLDRLDPVAVPTDPAACESVDTPADRAMVDRRLGGRVPSD